MGRGLRCASDDQYGTYRRISGAESYIAYAEWPTTNSPEVPGQIDDERSAARPPPAAGCHQRLLRCCRVRARAQPPRQDRAARRGRRKRRRGRGRAARQDRRVALRLPDRDHDGLDRDRLPRRALAGGAARTDLRRPLPRRRGRALGGDRLRPRHRDPHQHRRAGAEDDRDRPCRAHRPPRRPPAQLVPRRDGAGDPPAERDLQRDRAPLRRRSRPTSRSTTPPRT